MTNQRYSGLVIGHWSLVILASGKSRVISRIDHIDGAGSVGMHLDVGRGRLRLAQGLLEGLLGFLISRLMHGLALLACQYPCLDELLLEQWDAVGLVLD